MQTKIVKLGINGEGIGYQDRKPVFIVGALPEETVEYRIVEKNARYYIGKLERILTKSPKRIKPICSIQGRCDGCPLMMLDYQQQVNYKYDNLVQSLQKYAGIKSDVIKPLITNPNPLYYRNQLKLPVMIDKGKLVNGMYIQNSNFLVPIEKCFIHEKGLEQVRIMILEILNKHKITNYDNKTKKGLRYLVIRGIEEKYQCTLVSGEDSYSEELLAELMQVSGLVSLYQSIQTTKNTPNIFGKKLVLLKGDKDLEFKLDDIKLRLSPQSFFQLNTGQAKILYQEVKKNVKPNSNLILEAYSGIGGISLYLKDMAKQIKGVEYIDSAVSNANANAKLNKASNVQFVVGDAAEKMSGWCKKQTPDVIIVDPPRSGLDDKMIDTILRSKAKQVIYVSCNPSTLAKNLADLKKRYVAKSIVPVDMFSQTQHVESVTILHRMK